MREGYFAFFVEAGSLEVVDEAVPVPTLVLGLGCVLRCVFWWRGGMLGVREGKIHT